MLAIVVVPVTPVVVTWKLNPVTVVPALTGPLLINPIRVALPIPPIAAGFVTQVAAFAFVPVGLLVYTTVQPAGVTGVPVNVVLAGTASETKTRVTAAPSTLTVVPTRFAGLSPVVPEGGVASTRSDRP